LEARNEFSSPSTNALITLLKVSSNKPIKNAKKPVNKEKKQPRNPALSTCGKEFCG
jgi:hypothetical protein